MLVYDFLTGFFKNSIFKTHGINPTHNRQPNSIQSIFCKQLSTKIQIHPQPKTIHNPIFAHAFRQTSYNVAINGSGYGGHIRVARTFLGNCLKCFSAGPICQACRNPECAAPASKTDDGWLSRYYPIYFTSERPDPRAPGGIYSLRGLNVDPVSMANFVGSPVYRCPHVHSLHTENQLLEQHILLKHFPYPI